MSGTGKAKSNDTNFESFQLMQNAKFENFMAQNTNIDHAQFFTTPPPQTNIKKFLELGLGNIIGGALGYNASIIQIDSGSIDIGFGSGKFASHIIVQAESGTTDTLTDINNFVYSYQDLTIQADSGDTITVTETGNILLGDSISSIILNSNEQLRLRFDIRTDKWRAFVGVGTGGSGGGPFLPTAGGTMLGSIGYDPDSVFVDSNGRVTITSSYMQSTASAAPDNEVFFFDGALFNGQQLEYQVGNTTVQVIKNAVLKTITNIVGDGVTNIITVTIDDTSSLVNGDSVNIQDTVSYNLDNAIITVTGGTTFTYDLGSIGATTNETGTMQRGNIVMPNDQDLTLDSDISIQGVAIATFVFDPTIPGGGGWRLVSSTVSGGGANLLPLNNTWTGTNTFQSTFTVTGTVTGLASTVSTSITSPEIFLGDAASDDISFLAQVDTNIVMEEISEPGTAPANTGRFYAKLSGGVSVPFWKDEAGTESSMISGGGDMILSAAQTVTGVKTFLNTTLGLRNALNTQTGVFTHNALVNPVWTLPSINQVLVGTTLSQPLTNKTIDGDLNTILDINETQMNVSVGASGTILTSNGVGNPPTYQSGGGANLLPLNNTWTGTNTFQSTFTVTGTVTGLASTVSTSITSPQITLGDQASDDINFLGSMNTKILWNTTVDLPSATETGIGRGLTELRHNVTSANKHSFFVGGSQRFEIGNNAMGPLASTNIKLFLTSNGTFAPLNIEPTAGNPSSLGNGDIWYNSSSDTLFGRINNANVDLGAAGGGGTGPPFDDNQVIIQDENDNSKTLTFNLSLVNGSASNILSWAVGGSRTHTFAPTGGIVAQLNLTQSWTAIQNFNSGLNVSGANTTMFTNLFMSGASITIGANQRLRASTGSSEIGIFVTNATSSLGIFGSMQMPVDTGNVGSAAAANTDFGSEIGCFGVYLNNGGSPTFVIKKSASAWSAMTIPNAGNVSAGQLT